MTVKKAALDRLIQAVRVGVFLADVLPPHRELEAYDAFSGSQDAAVALFNALLPGWWCHLRISTRPRAEIGWLDMTADEQSTTPARALLLATLVAYRGQA